MNRGYIAIGAVLVAAAAIVLYGLVGRDDGSEVKHASRDAAPTAQAGPGSPGAQPRLAPSADGTGERAGSTGSNGTREYTVGGVRIRDHRAGEHAPPYVPPTVHPPGGRKIPSELTSGIAQKVRAVVEACAATVPPDARGDKPRAEGEILISIKDQRVTVTSATVQLRDVVGAAVAPVKHCIEQKSVGVTAPSGDEPDIEGYPITLSLRLP